MIVQHEYAYRVWYCKLDDSECHRDGACNACLWAKMENKWKIETSKRDTLEPTKTKEIEK